MKWIATLVQIVSSVLMSLLLIWTADAAPTKLINNGPDAQKKVIVVLGDGYAAADQTKFNDDVNKLVIKGVFGHDFFEENQNAFNVYRLNLTSAESGVSQRKYDEKGTPLDASDDTIQSETPKDTALKIIYSGSWCHCWMEWSSETQTRVNKALEEIAKYDYVVILLNEQGLGGCGGGGFQTVTSGVSWEVLGHEYGHGIGGLADEYFDASTTWKWDAVNGPNCSTVADRNQVHWRRFISPSTTTPTTFSTGMDSNRTVGLFEGCGTIGKGIYRPVDNCRMRGNTPHFCPVCYAHMSKALYPYRNHSFVSPYAGDFNGDGRTDVLLHNGDDLTLYHRGTTGNALDLAWIANNQVPGPVRTVLSPTPWETLGRDRYVVGDFTGDGKDDVFVFNSLNWSFPKLAVLRSTGTGFQCAGIQNALTMGLWALNSGSTNFQVGDFDGDGKDDLLVSEATFYGTMPSQLALLKWDGTKLVLVVRYSGSLPGWSLQPYDKFTVGDFDGDGKSDVYVYNGRNWEHTRFLAFLKSSGTGLARVNLFTNSIPGAGGIPGWSFNSEDSLWAGDFDGDHKADLFLSNQVNYNDAYLALMKSTGTGLTPIRQYSSSVLGPTIAGWTLSKMDSYFVADINQDGKADLYAYNKFGWDKSRLGALVSSGTALSGWAAYGNIGLWQLGDMVLRAGADKPELFLYNTNRFGIVGQRNNAFALNRVYTSWIYTPLYDANPWSNTMP